VAAVQRHGLTPSKSTTYSGRLSRSTSHQLSINWPYFPYNVVIHEILGSILGGSLIDVFACFR
jgi:hypothetical protein